VQVRHRASFYKNVTIKLGFSYKTILKVKVKVKQSRYRPGVAQRVPGK